MVSKRKQSKKSQVVTVRKQGSLIRVLALNHQFVAYGIEVQTEKPVHPRRNMGYLGITHPLSAFSWGLNCVWSEAIIGEKLAKSRQHATTRLGCKRHYSAQKDRL